MNMRKIIVLMPFGGRDPIKNRKAILNFKRLQYLIQNQCNIAAVDGTKVIYEIEVCRMVIDNIPEQVLTMMRKADILIALLTDINNNVIFETGYCYALSEAKRERLILFSDSEEGLPIYLKQRAYITWNQEDVIREIDEIANKPIIELPDFKKSEIPTTLELVVKTKDGALRTDLETALQQIENKYTGPWCEPVRYLRAIVSDMVETYYPSSIVEVSFDGPGSLSAKDPLIVQECDEEFIRLYNFGGKNALRFSRPLTAQKIIDRIKPFVEPDDFESFMKDQAELINTVVCEHGIARAKIPIRFNHKHPDDSFRGKAYLPCLVAQAMDEDTSGPHKMYLLIQYIELPPTVAPQSPTAAKKEAIHD